MPNYIFRKKDSNQTAIVSTLRKLGLRVHIWSGEADLIVQWQGISTLCEVRPADKPKVARPGRQAKFQRDFCVYWLQTDEDCLALFNTLRRWHSAIKEAV